MAGPSPEQLAAANMAAVEQVRERVLKFAQGAWGSLDSYRDADIDRLVAMVVPRVQAGQVQVAQLTSAYLAKVTDSDAALVNPGAVTGGRGVPAAQVYRRPGATLYTKLSKGQPLSKAAAAGGNRLTSLVLMDMQMSKVRQAQFSLQRAGVQEYRRVLTGRENCGLCVVASTQRYHFRNLLPIHPGCDCMISPLPKDSAFIQVIEPELLESVQSEIDAHTVTGHDPSARDLGQDKLVDYSEGTRLADYTDLIIVRDHGEHGPSLRWRDQHFTGPAGL